ncbi:MAG: MBL fold metallo-hydrolase, partial [Gemmatimonadaceae bacterium]
MRRPLIAVVLATVIVLALNTRAARGQEITVTLLGTGNPMPVMNRFGPSTLVEVGSHRFLFDAGRGAMQRLAQLKVRWADIDGVFLTHLHSDHVVGFPDLWLTGWLVAPGRDRALQVWGPEGTSSFLAGLTSTFAFDIGVRKSDDRASPEGVRLDGHEIREGIVYQQDGVTITAFDVDHAPVAPALGYRIDYAGRSVVLSGDTRVSENLIRHAA